MNIWKVTGILSASVLAGGVCYSLATGHGLDIQEAVAGESQPRMEAASKHLHAARDFLEKGEHNKGGHRVKAIELTDKAIAEVDEGVEAGE